MNPDNLTPQQKRKIEKLMKLVEDGNLAILEHLLELEESLTEKETELKSMIDQFRTELPNLDKLAESIKGQDGLDGVNGEDGAEGPQGLPGPKGDKGDPGERGQIGPQGQKGDIGPKGERGDQGEPGKDGSSDTPEQIKDKLQSIGEEEDKLGITAIKNLRKELDDLKKNKSQGGGSGISGRDFIKDMDISSQLNGSQKTFSIPAVYNIILVNLSSFPYGALRKGVDYTWTPTSITFTDQIDATSQLAEGTSCILTVVTQ